MSSHSLTAGVYGLFALTGIGLQVRSRKPGSRIPSLGAMFTRVMRTRSGRIGVMTGWAWLGLHFFVR